MTSLKETNLSFCEALAPVELDEFLESYYGKEFLVVRGAAQRFRALFSWADMNSLLASHGGGWLRTDSDDIAHRRLSLMCEGEYYSLEPLVTASPGRRTDHRQIPASAIMRMVRRGATIGIDSLEELCPAVARFAENVERVLGEVTSVNLYTSSRTTSGLGNHWDAQDAFVMHIEGSKYWQVLGESRRFAHHKDPDLNTGPPEGSVLWEGMLGPGDLVYLPRGWWHRVQTHDTAALSLTVRVFRRTGLDLLHWLMTDLQESEAFRADLPRLASPQARAAHVRRLRESLHACLDDQVLARYYAGQDAHALPRRQTYGFPWMAQREVVPSDDEFAVRLVAPRTPVVEQGSNGPVVRAIGQSWQLTSLQLALVRCLFDGAWHTMAELLTIDNGQLGRDGVHALLRDLVLDGLLAVESDSR